MDPRTNPYAPGAGTKPPALVGRDEQIESFDILLERLENGYAEKSMIITGLRGVGKTVLLDVFRERLLAGDYERAAFVVEQREQEAEQARQVSQGLADAGVIEAEGRALARVIEAEAEKEALDLIAAALRGNPDLLTFEYIQKLGPGIQVMLIPSDNPFLLPLPELGSGLTP